MTLPVVTRVAEHNGDSVVVDGVTENEDTQAMRKARQSSCSKDTRMLVVLESITFLSHDAKKMLLERNLDEANFSLFLRRCACCMLQLATVIAAE